MSQCDTRIDGDCAVVVLGGEVDLSWSAQVRRGARRARARAARGGGLAGQLHRFFRHRGAGGRIPERADAASRSSW